MESKRKNVYITIFVITTIIAAGLAIFFKVDGDNKLKSMEAKIGKNDIEQSDITDSEDLISDYNQSTDNNISEKSTNIPTNDLFAVDSQNMLLAKIIDGDLYYFLLDESKDFDYIATNIPDKYYVKLDSGVKRIKTVSLGSDTNVSYLVIKEDGTVYQMYITLSDDLKSKKVSYNKYDALSVEKIDDVLSIEGHPGSKGGISAKVKLIDGKIKDINN